MSVLAETSLTSSHVMSSITRKLLNGKEAKVLIPAGQVAGALYLPVTRLFAFDGVPSGLIANNASPWTGTMGAGVVESFQSAVLRLDITISGAAAQLVPTLNWFKRVTISNSNEQILATFTPESLLHALTVKYGKNVQSALFKNINMSADYGLTPSMDAASYTFRIPLVGSWINRNQDLYYSELVHPLRFEFTPNTTVVASGAGTVTVTRLALELEGDHLSTSDIKTHKHLTSTAIKENMFVEPVNTMFASTTLTAGVSTDLDLTPLDGLASHHAILIRATTSTNNNVAGASLRYLNLGDESSASVDILDAIGNSIFTSSSGGIETRHLRTRDVIEQYDNDFMSKKPFYILPFTDSVKGAVLGGQVNGAFSYCSGRKASLRITPGTASVNEVQTLTSSAALAAGSYRFHIGGELSAEIAFGATVGTMKSTLEAMDYFINRNVTVTASATAAAGASFTLTFVCPENGTVGGKVTLVGNATAQTTATVITTPGRSGFTTGTYDVQLITWFYKKTQLSQRSLNAFAVKAPGYGASKQ